MDLNFSLNVGLDQLLPHDLKMNYRDLDTLNNIHVYLDVSIGDVKYGRVVIELFKDHAPKTTENFRALCTGEKGVGGLKKPLHYKNSIFHKAIPECLVQGGDITNFDGTGGESIYGPYFQDENTNILHSDKGLLSMANCGIPNTNNSQFSITLNEAPHLDNSYVVFGRVVKGFQVINEISYQIMDNDCRPVPVCKVYDCGELRPGQDWAYCSKEHPDIYPPYPEDWEHEETNLQMDSMMEVVCNIKEVGNRLLKEDDFTYSHQKYKKALRYISWYLTQHPEELEAFLPVNSQCQLNLALACLKLKYFREAIFYCDEVLKQEYNVKALFRRGMAHKGLNDHEDALRDLYEAHSLTPDEPIIALEIARITNFLNNYKLTERHLATRMFRTTTHN